LSIATPARPPDPGKVNQVLKWVLDGQSRADIVEAVEKHFPGEEPGALLAAVMIAFETTAANFNADVVAGWCFEAYRDLYRRMVDTGDYAGAMKAAKLMLELARDHVPNDDEESEREAGQG